MNYNSNSELNFNNNNIEKEKEKENSISIANSKENQNYLNEINNKDESNIINKEEENLLISFSNISELNKTNINKENNKLNNEKIINIDNSNLNCNNFEFTPINNSRCWFTIPGIGSFQPSEFMKIFIMLILATMIHNFRSDYKNPTIKEEFIFILKTLGIVLIPSILTFLQPDTGAVLIYLIIYFSMMFVSGIRLRWFVGAGSLLVILIIGILGLYFYKENLFIKLFGTSIYYRLDRIFNWQNGSGLQLENALAAIGSAGLFGHGYNNTPIYFPESSTDFIFAVYASNFGLIGVLILLTIIIYLDIQIILLTRKKILDTDKFIVAGILGMLIFQQIQNIGMTVGLLPITGITLPFVSYGGSSLLSYMLLVGILLNISVKKNRTYKYK